MFLSFRQKPEDTGSIFGFSIYFSNGSWHLDLYMFTIVYSKGSYLRSTCDVLGNVQMLTCEHKKSLLFSFFKLLYLRFTCDVLGNLQMLICEQFFSLLEIYMWCSWTCTGVYLWTQKETFIDLSKTSLLEIYMCCFWVFLGTSLHEIYMCRGWSWAPTDVYLWAGRFFKVPWNLFTWDLHVMILNMYRCLLVSRNNILWFFKTFLQTSALGLCKTNCIKVWGKKTVCWHCQFWLHHTMNFICPYCCPKVWESLESNSNLSSQTPRV